MGTKLGHVRLLQPTIIIVMTEPGDLNSIQDSFRSYYCTFESALQTLAGSENGPPEPDGLASLGDQLDKFLQLLNQVCSQTT